MKLPLVRPDQWEHHQPPISKASPKVSLWTRIHCENDHSSKCDRQHGPSILTLLSWRNYQHCEEVLNNVANLKKDKIQQRRDFTMKNENSPYKGEEKKRSMLRGHCRQYRMQKQHSTKKQMVGKADGWDYYLGTADALWLEYFKKCELWTTQETAVYLGAIWIWRREADKQMLFGFNYLQKNFREVNICITNVHGIALPFC